MKPLLMYGTPTGERPMPAYVNSMLAITRGATAFRGQSYHLCRGLFPIARSGIASSALRGIDHADGVHHDFDYLAMHDDDLYVESSHPELGNPLDYFLGLMEANPEVGMVGAVYLGVGPVLPELRFLHPAYPPDPPVLVRVVKDFPNEPFEVGIIGTGFVLVRMAAMRDLAKANDGPMFRCAVRPNRWGPPTDCTEDVDFCHRLRQRGWKILASPQFRTVHYKVDLFDPVADAAFRFPVKDLRWDYRQYHARERQDLRPVSKADAGRTVRIGDALCLDPTPEGSNG